MPSGALSAQVPPPDSIPPDSTYVIQGVVVTGQRQASTVEGTVGLVVHPDSLTLRPVATLEDALRELPFVLVRQNSRGQAEVSVRGSESRQVAVLLDGVPLSLSWDHRTDPAVLPLMGAQSLEFVRGLPTMLNGPNVLGGVIAVDVGSGGGSVSPPDAVRVSAGVDDGGARAVGAAGHRVMPLGGDDRLVLRGGSGYRSRDGVNLPGDITPAVPGGDQRTNSDSRQTNGFGALRWEGEERQWVSLAVSGVRAERGVPPELHTNAPRLWRYPEEWQAVSALSAGTGIRDTPWGAGDLEASVGLVTGRQEIDAYATTAYDQVVGNETGRDRNLTLRLVGDHTLPGNAELGGALTFADVNHTETVDADAPADYRQRLWSAGAEVSWLVGRTTRLSGGAAFDGADTPETGGRPAQPRQTAWGARLGVSTLALRTDLQLHASASTRARFPALRELYSGALGRFEANPALRPERLVAGEVGATFKRTGVELQAVVFHHDLADAVVRTTTVEGMFKRVNRDAIRSTGLELLLNAHLGQAEVLGDFMVQGVTVAEEGQPDSARRAENMPRVRAGVDVKAPLALAIRGLASVHHTGSQYCLSPEAGGDIQLAASTRLDAGVQRSWRFGAGPWRELRASATLDNAADAAIYDQCGMPQPGRTLRVGVELL